MYYHLGRAPKGVQRGVDLTDAGGTLNGGLVQDGSLNGSALVDGSVTMPKLDPALRQAFKVKFATNKSAPAVDLAFTNQILGAALWADTSHLKPTTTEWFRIHGRLKLRAGDSAMAPGARAQMVMVDSLGNVFIAGDWSEAVLTSDGAVEIDCGIDEFIQLTGGSQYTFRFNGQLADGTTPTDWTVEGPSLSSSPPVRGSFVEGCVVPNNG